MVVGGGLLAKAFEQRFGARSDIAIFASGVANSRECNEAAFKRERDMLEKETAAGRRLVYFSTCSLYDPELSETPYSTHKLEMEELVSKLPDHTIFRLPQVVGRTRNINTLTNFITAKIIAGDHFEVWHHASRNIIDVEDVAAIAELILKEDISKNLLANIACPFSVSITELIGILEIVLERRASYTTVEAGGSYGIETELSTTVATKAGIVFDDSYVTRVLTKYYG